MVDARSLFKDMVKQRRVQAATGVVAILGVTMWLMCIPLGEYLAAGAVILFAVATIRWIDDEEKIKEEQLQQPVGKK
ncbi:MAG: hypothetical protein A4E28_01274 [Methanocella sp. PtaU1.Bin125]|nr:MAG: hypothetical protein A4E28_01274 [Methanocella sp. PtaU1.Bin125]